MFRGVVWNEDNLKKNEDEKTPKMKIDEPKTPYVPPIGACPMFSSTKCLTDGVAGACGKRTQNWPGMAFVIDLFFVIEFLGCDACREEEVPSKPQVQVLDLAKVC